jgi:RNA polymerase sigma factor (TIGR02999 family)
MSEVTRMLQAVENGDPKAAEELLPIVYEELRRLATHKMAHEKPGQTLQATALVHEAYLRLVREEERKWCDSRHFYCAAAAAMRQILIDNARRKQTAKHGGDLTRVPADFVEIACPVPSEELLALDEALVRLANTDPDAAQLIQLRFFTGLTQEAAAVMLGIPVRTADRTWAYARAWLYREIKQGNQGN